MALADELAWQERKAVVKANIDSFLNAGISLDAARAASGWNITLEFDNFSDLQVFPPPVTPIVPSNGLKQSLKLLFSRSENRVNAGSLEGAVLDAGKLYSIFIQDIPELNIADIAFELNSSPVHHEYATPWDYAGTAGGGVANRITFVAGSYTIEAIVNETGGPYSFDASFTVE